MLFGNTSSRVVQGAQPSSAQSARTRQLLRQPRPRAGREAATADSCLPSPGVKLTTQSTWDSFGSVAKRDRPGRLEKLLFLGILLRTELLTAQQSRNSREPAVHVH